MTQIREQNLDPEILFDDFVEDAITTITFFDNLPSFKNIFIIGHGQGSLVGLLAAIQTNGVDGFISIAGAGHSMDTVLLKQIEQMAPGLVEPSKSVFSKLKSGETTTNYPEVLETIFRPDIQPFLANWIQYDPCQVISGFNGPVLIINGTKDLQVSTEEAQLLADAQPNSELLIVDKMNHVLFKIDGDELENSKSYSEPYRPLAEPLLPNILKFIGKNSR